MTTIEYRLPPDYRAASLRADALAGLTATPKSLPPKWFYDAQGSALFEKITELPEYYPTRAERSILSAAADEIARLSQARVLVELGSGSSEKTRLLLSALRAAGLLRAYVAVDVSESALVGAEETLAVEYPGLAVHAVVSDFEQYLGLEQPPSGADAASGADTAGPRLVAFLGSTIGNMVPAERAVFLRRVRAQPPAGRLLPARHRPRQGRRSAGGRLRRLGRGDRRVQQERARGAQRRARRGLRSGRVRARGGLGPGQRVDRDAAALDRATAGAGARP